jgi:hypothetical protein
MNLDEKVIHMISSKDIEVLDLLGNILIEKAESNPNNLLKIVRENFKNQIVSTLDSGSPSIWIYLYLNSITFYNHNNGKISIL